MTATLDRRADYVSAVAVELGDLAADDRAELIEELDDHVAALLEDRPEADLVAELGTPRAYAAELRTAAGLVGGTGGPLPLRQRLRELVQQADAAVPDRVRPVFAAVRPAWWVLRGYLVAAFVAVTVWSSSWRVPFVPSFGGNWVVGAVATLVAVIASVRLGSWRPPHRGWVAAVLVLDLVVLWCGLVVTDRLRTQPPSVYVETQYTRNCPIELSNLYAYDASGKPLDHVRLYDQNGTPFDLSTFQCNGGQFVPGSDGVNSYPWPTWTADQAAAPTGPPSSLAPLPGATVSSTPAASSAPSAGPNPTATP